MPLFVRVISLLVYINTDQWRFETSQSSRMQNLKIRLPTDSNILYTPEPNKNMIVFIIPFNIPQLFK